MIRMLVACGVLVGGLTFGTVAEVSSWSEREPVFERGVIVGAAFVVSGILAAGIYLLWPRSA